MSIFFYFFNISQKPVDVINLFFQNRQQWRVQIIDHATHLQALEQADVREGFKVHGSGLPFGDTPLLQEADFAIGQQSASSHVSEPEARYLSDCIVASHLRKSPRMLSIKEAISDLNVWVARRASCAGAIACWLLGLIWVKVDVWLSG